MGDGTCAHEACTCPSGNDDYCSEYCRERAGAEDALLCECGHDQCQASGEEEVAV
jgi:hypothetical protein